MFDKLKMLIMGKQKTVVANAQAGFGFGNTMACYKYGSYDNTFPNITRIAESFMTIQPYAVDMKGNRVANANAISAIYHPNKEMSSVDFFEALMVMALVHPTVYLLCWKREGRNVTAGGVITEKNLAGFTFLESPAVYRNANGTVTYRQGTQEYSDKEVISISLNTNPYNLLDGYSPSIAAKKWSNVDDAIVDFQAGYFRNGAVPAGQFIVTASSADEFNKIVDKLQANHRGAGNNNNVVYVHRPTSSIDGKPLNAQIEWVPFAQSNKDMTLQTLFDQANKKIDMDFGVPQEVKGYLQNSNYASANVAERVFDKYVVAPKALKIWTKFTHELNRITGGLGYAISFEYNISALADEDKVVAETRRIQFETLGTAVASGFTLDSAIEALDLPESFKTLALTAPEAPEMPEASEESNYTASQAETALKGLQSAKSKDLGEDERAEWEQINPKLRKPIEDSMQAQIDSAIAGKEYDVKAGSKILSGALLVALIGILTDEGEKRYDDAKNEIRDNGGDVSKLNGYSLGEDVRSTYEQYLDEVAFSYSEDTAASIRRTLERGDFEKLPQEQIEENLRNIMQTDEWRLRRLSKTEEHRATMSGDIDAMRQVQKDTGLTVYKVWHLNPASLNHCEHCEELDGVRIPLDEEFLVGQAGDGMVADYHPNCACYLSFEFEDYKPTITVASGKSVKVTCPHCGRYMFESTDSNVKNVICSNSKCKKHWDISVVDGKVSAKENA